jgi:hypothetical protein
MSLTPSMLGNQGQGPTETPSDSIEPVVKLALPLVAFAVDMGLCDDDGDGESDLILLRTVCQ